MTAPMSPQGMDGSLQNAPMPPQETGMSEINWAPPPTPTMDLGPANVLYHALRKANIASREGISAGELDSFLLDRFGMTKKALTAAVKAMPQEVLKKPVTTALMLKAEAYGLTGGWSTEIEGLLGALKGTGYTKAKKTAEAEMRKFEKDYPMLARGAQALGLGVGAIAGGVAGLATKYGMPMALRGTASLAKLNAARSKLQLSPMNPILGAARRALVGGAVGANAGAGGMLDADEAQGMARIPGAAGGALGGAALGVGAGMPVGNPLRRLLPWVGGAAAGAGGNKILDFLTDRK